MSDSGYGVMPGFQEKSEAAPVQLSWTAHQGLDLVATRKVVVGSQARDAGNDPTTTLRAGLIMARKTADGKFYPYAPKATDGTQIPLGMLERSLDLLDNGVATDRFTQVLVQGMVRESRLVGLDPFARAQLASTFLFDREESNAGRFGNTPRGVRFFNASYNVTAADHGMLLVAQGNVTFTLPAKQHGLVFRFLQMANASMGMAGSGDLVYGGSSTANVVEFNTVNERIGSQALLECLYAKPDTLVWVVTNLGGTTAVVA